MCLDEPSGRANALSKRDQSQNNSNNSSDQEPLADIEDGIAPWQRQHSTRNAFTEINDDTVGEWLW